MAEKAAQTVRDVLAGYTAVPDEVRDYAADTASGILDDMEVCRMCMCSGEAKSITRAHAHFHAVSQGTGQSVKSAGRI